MDILKIIGIALVGVAATLLVKRTNGEYALLVSVTVGAVIFMLVLEPLGQVVTAFQEIVEKTNVDTKLIVSVMKIIGVGYLTEFAASISEDLGESAIAKKVLFAGKISILVLALPVVRSAFELIGGLFLL